MKQKNLLITFDYELFLGRRSGRPEDCMLHPTDLLRSILSHFKVKAVFFADTTYLCKLAELAPHHKQCAQDLDHISAQILQLVDDGHYVLPHIHPHWLDAVYSSTLREFDLSNITRYRFHQLSLAERDAVFSSSVEILRGIIHPKHPDYRINGFRAGGWSLQPFADFKPCFEKHGIVYDMSVVKGLYQFSNAQVYDYSDTPDKPVYRFTQDVSVESGEGPFVEICGTLIRVSQMVDYIDRAHKKVLNVVGFDRDYGKGIGQQSMEIKNQLPMSQQGINVFDKSHEVASLENLSSVKLPQYEKVLLKDHFLHLVSHPKMLGRHNFYILQHFLNMVHRKVKPETDYMKIADYYLQKSTTGTP